MNVHPQKLEVRFAEAQVVYAAVRHTIARAVATAPWLLGPRAQDGAGAQGTSYSLPRAGSGVLRLYEGDPRRGYGEKREQVAEALRLFAPSPSLPGFHASPPSAVPQAHDAERFFSTLTYLGQLDRTYLVCEAPGELVLIDQHAAHESVAFQRLREAHDRRQVRTQRLLLPATLESVEHLRARLVEFVAKGDVELTGERAVTVRSMPETLASAAPAEMLSEVLAELEAKEGAGVSSLVQDHLDHILATMACHSVVRAGDVLSEREVRALLESMDGVDYRAHCPHGRPVLLRLPIAELERRFGRT